MEQENSKGFDWGIFLPVSFILLFSLAAVYSSSASIAEFKFGATDIFFQNQLRNILIAFGIILIFYRIDYRIWRKLAKPLLFLSIFALIAIFFVGTSIKGANRWIDLGFINFQPSELAKFALVVYISRLLEERNELLNEFKYVSFPAFFWTSIVCGLIALQPNFSSSSVVLFVVIALLLIGNVKFKHIFWFGITSICLAGIFAVSAEYRLNRLTSFFNALTSNSSDVNYQGTQALIAFGNGGFWGLGPGQSRQSQLFLPESYGDFIFAIIGEEYGFLGLFALLLLLSFILYKIYKVAKTAPDRFGFLLASGIFLLISFYTIINAMVNIGFLPTTGLPMPFISYGGSAIIIYGISIGIILNISSHKSIVQNQT